MGRGSEADYKTYLCGGEDVDGGFLNACCWTEGGNIYSVYVVECVEWCAEVGNSPIVPT